MVREGNSLIGMINMHKNESKSVVNDLYRSGPFNDLDATSRGHRTENFHFSFKFQRMAMPKNVQTTAQVCSFYILAR